MTKSNYSRREFLQKSAGITGASLVGGSVLLEPDPLVALSPLSGASDRVRFGIVGVGMEGTGLLTTAVALPGVECVAACDLYDGRHELAKEIAGASIRTTRRYKELLDDKTIDRLWWMQWARARTCIAKSRCHTARRTAWQWWRQRKKQIVLSKQERNAPVRCCARRPRSCSRAAR